MTATFRWACTLVTLAGGLEVGAARAQAPVRDLSDYSNASTPFGVVITLNVPPGTIAAGVEDAPPANWSVGTISDSGTWDAQSLSVKWGPFFDPGIPATVSYEVTPTGTGSISCFAGIVSNDGIDEPIGGDDCVGNAVPATSTWVLCFMMLCLLVSATLLLRRKVRCRVRTG